MHNLAVPLVESVLRPLVRLAGTRGPSSPAISANPATNGANKRHKKRDAPS